MTLQSFRQMTLQEPWSQMTAALEHF